MSAFIEAIETTAKLAATRETIRKFWGSEYTEKIQPYKALIESVMKAHNLEAIPALLMIAKTETFESGPLTPAMFLTATAEIIAPTNNTTQP